MTTIDINPTVALCVERAQQHQALAADASTDEERRAHDEIQKLTDAEIKKLDTAALAKEKEILELK